MSSVINDVGGARFKDLFVLYPKTTLGQLNHALQNKVDVADLSLSNNDLKDAINASQPITAKLPNTYVDFQVWKQSLMPLLPVRPVSCKAAAGAQRRYPAGIGMRHAGCAGD